MFENTVLLQLIKTGSTYSGSDFATYITTLADQPIMSGHPRRTANQLQVVFKLLVKCVTNFCFLFLTTVFSSI